MILYSRWGTGPCTVTTVGRFEHPRVIIGWTTVGPFGCWGFEVIATGPFPIFCKLLGLLESRTNSEGDFACDLPGAILWLVVAASDVTTMWVPVIGWGILDGGLVRWLATEETVIVSNGTWRILALTSGEVTLTDAEGDERGGVVSMV